MVKIFDIQFFKYEKKLQFTCTYLITNDELANKQIKAYLSSMLCHTSKPVRSGRILCGSILFPLLPLTCRQEFKFCTFSVVTGATFRLEPYSPNLLS